jgi:glutaminase
MTMQPSGDDAAVSHVSTGRLPSGHRIKALLEEAYERFKDNDQGACSQVYPALAAVPRELFGICVVATSGAVHAVGDAGYECAAMGVSKPFVFALICQRLGPEQARARLGVNNTGLPADSVAAVERSRDGRTNPMVDAGAIATTSLAPGASSDARWQFIRDGLSRFAGRTLPLNHDVYAAAMRASDAIRGVARLMRSRSLLDLDPSEAIDLYSKQCAVNVTAKDLAVMGATLADGGVNPVTGERVIDTAACHCTLAVMATAGLYEISGDWLCQVGFPGASGIGGAMVGVSPGKGALGTFAPPLDDAGHSVKGGVVAQFLSQRLGMDLFASKTALG